MPFLCFLPSFLFLQANATLFRTPVKLGHVESNDNECSLAYCLGQVGFKLLEGGTAAPIELENHLTSLNGAATGCILLNELKYRHSISEKGIGTRQTQS